MEALKLFSMTHVEVDAKTHTERERERVQELCESRGGRPGLSVLTSLTVSVDVNIEPCFGSGHSLSLICQPTSEDMKLYIIIIREREGGGRGRED